MLLPERLAALAEELVDEGGDAVGEGVGVEQRIVERVPLPRAAQPDFEVVVPAPGVREDFPHLMAEVALDFEHERASAAAGIVGLPGEKLLGERMHAGGGLARPDRPDDEHAGVESLLRDDEPGGPLALGGGRGVVQFADHDRRRVVAGRRGPRGELAPGAAPCERPEPDLRHRQGNAAREEHGEPGRQMVPGADDGVDARIVPGDQVEVRVVRPCRETARGPPARPPPPARPR